MAIDTLTDTVLDEAKAIVRAEWMRLQLNNTALGESQIAEAPAARPHPTHVTQLTTTLDRNWATSWQQAGSTRRRQNRVWPTQRSPPTHNQSLTAGIYRTEVMP